MTDDALHDRGKALEDKFFKDRDKELLKRLREDYASDTMHKALGAASGIDDAEVLKELHANGLTVENVTAISIVPLVAVAWADDKMEPNEIEAVLKACEQTGIQKDDPSYMMVRSWLATKPEPELLAAWKEYVKALSSSLDKTAYAQLKHSVMQRAKDVADSAGGFLGLGNKTSAVEQKVLDELQAAFD